MIIVVELSADYEVVVRMLENNPLGLERAVIERIVGNQYNRLRRQQHNSKALSASESTKMADRGEEEKEAAQPIRG